MWLRKRKENRKSCGVAVPNKICFSVLYGFMNSFKKQLYYG